MRSLGEAVRSALRLVTAGHPDPRGPQAVVLIPLLVDITVATMAGHRPVLSPFGIGVLLLLGVSLLALLGPWEVWPHPWSAVVPLCDMVVIGLVNYDHFVTGLATGVGIMVIFPVLWLGREFGRSGVLLAVLGTVAVISLPTLWMMDTGIEATSRAIVYPVVALMCAMSMHVMTTEWTRQRNELQEARNLHEAILQTVDVGIVKIDRDGVFVAMNPTQQRFMDLAYPDGHLGLAGETGYVYAENRQTALTRGELPTYRASQGETFSDYVVWVGKDIASRRALSVSCRPITDNLGRFNGAVLGFHDITDLMRALQVKDDFVASVSHELRTPLTSILGYVDIVLDDDANTLPLDVTRHLEVVNRNAMRLMRLVGDLLHTASSQQGKVVLDTQLTDLASMLVNVIDRARPEADKRFVRILTELDDVPALIVDQARICEVLGHLVSNAVKYSHEGGIVKVALAQVDHQVRITVRDSGIGISGQDQSRLFTKFFRADQVESAAIPGVGLGLAITKSIVEAHGGRIELDSELGAGTTVQVRLPLRTSHEQLIPLARGASV